MLLCNERNAREIGYFDFSPFSLTFCDSSPAFAFAAFLPHLSLSGQASIGVISISF